MAHPLRYIVPPLVLILAVLWLYVRIRRHAIAQREHPHHNPHKPVTHVTAASVLAAALIVAFIAAFILP